MPKVVEECVKSVLADNPEYSEQRAYSICVAMRNRNELEVSDNPSHDELLTAAAQQEIDCPEGHVHTGSQCVPIEEVRDVPPSLLSSALQLSLDSLESEPIEREELSDGEVAYRNVKILQSGTWTDSNSRESIWYSPKGLSNMSLTDSPTVNIMHDADNELSEVGTMENLHHEDGKLYADVILDTSTNAGGYADENMQKTLETKGGKGFGGPSVEIPAKGQTVELNKERGVKELVEGKIAGLGLVANPASKPVSFAAQTSQRGVALSDPDQEVMKLESESRDMADVETYREVLESNGVDTGEMTDEEVMGLFEDLMESAEGEDMGDYEDDEEEDEEGMENEDGMEDDDEEEEEEMQDGDGDDDAIDVLEEQIDDLWDALDSMKEEMAAQEQLSDAREELADAETVKELSEAKDSLEERLEALEEEPADPRSLSGETEEETENRNARMVAERDSLNGTVRR